MNKENLLLLAEHLEKLPADYDHFNMQDYILDGNAFEMPEPDTITTKVIHNCGTCACAIGHAPIVKGLEAKKGENWEDYSRRVFGLEPYRDDWEFAFASEWAHEDDERHHTAHAAAKRLRYLAVNGEAPPAHQMLSYLDA